MIVIEVFQYFLITVIGIMIAYPLMLTLLSFQSKPITNFETSRTRKFAIVILSNNDEEVIAKSLYSLSGLVYPKNMFDIIVVSDHSSDRSADIARNLGALVLERENSEAINEENILGWAFGKIKERNIAYEAIVLFNANNLISGNYLEVMNYYLEKGNKVIQSSTLILPGSNSWRREIKRISFLLNFYVRPLGRKVLGLNTQLRCNGVCVSTDVLQTIPREEWSSDKDFGIRLGLQLNDIQKGYAPEAKVFEESLFPENYSMYRRFSYLTRIRKFLPKIAKQKGYKYFDSLLLVLTPAQTNLLIFVIMMVSTNTLLWYVNFLQPVFIWLWVGLGTLSVFHILMGLIAAKADRQLYKSLLYMPLVLILYIKSLLSQYFLPERKKAMPAKSDRQKEIVSGHS